MWSRRCIFQSIHFSYPPGNDRISPTFARASSPRSRFTGRISGSFLLGVGGSLGLKLFESMTGWYEMTGWWVMDEDFVLNMYLYNIHYRNIVNVPFQCQQITPKNATGTFAFCWFLFTNGITHTCFKSEKIKEAPRRLVSVFEVIQHLGEATFGV